MGLSWLPSRGFQMPGLLPSPQSRWVTAAAALGHPRRGTDVGAGTAGAFPTRLFCAGLCVRLRFPGRAGAGSWREGGRVPWVPFWPVSRRPGPLAVSRLPSTASPAPLLQAQPRCQSSSATWFFWN